MMEEPAKGFVVYRKKEVTDDDGFYSVTSKPKKGGKGEGSKRRAPAEPEVQKNRKQCGCGGHLHKCFGNCIGCGRILCAEEGEGPCFHCGAHVFDPSDMGKVPKELADDPEFQQAITLRDRLLQLDSDYATETLKVHDLGADWFREANSLYNENADYARQQYYKEEMEKRAEADIRRFDIDLGTGKIASAASRKK
ncbi:zinc finger motif, C2HC5-type domain-containing protein [Babesia caballi]|uniref:Zinc finger motif, C2HC5-type domain-containing protein n=1 Tax=Babesia caballi TaxID=5871 RepID=A0AAV4LQX1_BABCB|nr:zinc finger motif, C2HC5-type domain-containing protein [Babesia caballi]